VISAPQASSSARATAIEGLPLQPEPRRAAPRCRDGLPRPSGLPQRPQTIRPESPRSAFTDQLPQSGHAIVLSVFPLRFADRVLDQILAGPGRSLCRRQQRQDLEVLEGEARSSTLRAVTTISSSPKESAAGCWAIEGAAAAAARMAATDKATRLSGLTDMSDTP